MRRSKKKPPKPDPAYRIENLDVVRTYGEIADEMFRRHGIRMSKQRVAHLLSRAHGKIEQKLNRLERLKAL